MNKLAEIIFQIFFPQNKNIFSINVNFCNPFFAIRHLSELRTSTYPRLRSFRLPELLAKCNSLRSVMIEVEETTLSHQIQWAFGVKLRELIITGGKLVNVIPDAFLGK